jgi:hypothetical protein
VTGSSAEPEEYVSLVVGVDYRTGGTGLTTVADARVIAQVLRHDAEVGGPVWQVTLLSTTEDTVEDRIADEIQQLAMHAAGKHALFYFSGHGEVSREELVLRPRAGGRISVDWLMKRFNLSAALTVTVILDCCFSGGAGEDPEVYTSGQVPGTTNYQATLRENLALMTASRRDQEAREGDNLSPFTRLVASGLNGGAADPQGAVSIVDLFSYVSGYFLPDEQRPQLKINMTDVPFVLKRTEPRVPEHVLDKLADLFTNAGSMIRLDRDLHEGLRPEWPPTTDLTREQQDFDDLGKLRNLGMIRSERVEGGQEEPLYWAAIYGHRVGLTQIGQWYWSKVRRRRQAADDAAGPEVGAE